MGFRFQKRVSILPGVRVNMSKGGLSTSIGPRGADVNIGSGGVTTNAGIPGTGLSWRQKIGAGGKGGVMGVLTVAAGLGLAGYHYLAKHPEVASNTPVAAVLPAPRQSASAAAASQAVAAAAPANGIRYVHRGNSDLRATPAKSGAVLKKEAKGASLTLLATSGDWAQVKDGDTTGWMRASVLGDQPPE